MTNWKAILLASQWLLLSTVSAPTQKCLTFTASQPPHCLPITRLPMTIQQQALPPKEFDRPYDGSLKIEHMSQDEINRLCASSVKPGHRALACTRAVHTAPKSCTIFMMTEDDLARQGWDYSIVLRHELGHCAGWKHD